MSQIDEGARKPAAAQEGTSLLGLSVLVCDSPPALELMPPCLLGSPGEVTEASPPPVKH